MKLKVKWEEKMSDNISNTLLNHGTDFCVRCVLTIQELESLLIMADNPSVKSDIRRIISLESQRLDNYLESLDLTNFIESIDIDCNTNLLQLPPIGAG